MRLGPQTIALGTRSWTVRPLTLAQVQAIEPLLFATADARGTVAAAVAILKVALGRDHPDTAAGLDEIEAGAPEISAAVATVLRLGGFLPDGGDHLPGEGGADREGATGASTGPRSIAG